MYFYASLYKYNNKTKYQLISHFLILFAMQLKMSYAYWMKSWNVGHMVSLVVCIDSTQWLWYILDTYDYYVLYDRVKSVFL